LTKIYILDHPGDPGNLCSIKNTEIMFNIREYNSEDRIWLEKSFEVFQDGLVANDPDGILRRLDGYGKEYTAHTLDRVAKESGVFFIAEDDGTRVGFIVGVVQEQSELDKLESHGDRYGEVLELFVSEEYRGKGVADLLMAKMETFFKEKNCPFVYIGVLDSNKRAKNSMKNVTIK